MTFLCATPQDRRHQSPSSKTIIQQPTVVCDHLAQIHVLGRWKILRRRREVRGRPALQIRLLLHAFIAEFSESLAYRFVQVECCVAGACDFRM